MNLGKAAIFHLFGIGIFTWLVVASFGWLFEIFARNTLIVVGVPPIQNFWLIEFSLMVVYLGLLITLLRYSRRKILLHFDKTRKILIVLVVTTFLIQLIQFLTTLFVIPILTLDHAEAVQGYYDQLGPVHKITSSLLELFRYFIAALITMNIFAKQEDLTPLIDQQQ